MKTVSPSVRFASLILAVSFLAAQPWVGCGLACQFQHLPGQSAHHERGHQTLECHTGSWTQTAVAPLGSLGLSLPASSTRAERETARLMAGIVHQPVLPPSWIPSFEPPPPRA